MHVSFGIKRLNDPNSWAIEALWSTGDRQQLVGVYKSRSAAAADIPLIAVKFAGQSENISTLGGCNDNSPARGDS